MSTKQLFSNNANTTVAVTVNASDTQITVADASKFQNPANNGTYTYVTLENSGVIEIVKISNIVGNVMTVYGGLSGRGQEGTSASSFPVGTIVENRTTAGTLAGFVTDDVYLPKVASASALSVPSAMDAKAYMAGSDDGGSLVLAYAASSVLWNFPSYTLVQSGTCVSGNTVSADLGYSAGAYTAGKFIVQFTSGPIQGYPRAVTSITGTTIGWGTALPNAVGTNTYELYRSNYSVLGSGGGGGTSGYRGNVTSADGIALVTTTTPTFSSLTDGMEVDGYIVNSNSASTTPTLNANSTGAVTIQKLNGQALIVGELKGEVTLRYNSGLGKWILVNGGADTATMGTSIQLQSATAFTTAGTSTAYTLTPSPAITSNQTNLRFRVKFHTAPGVNPTLNVSTQGALYLKYKLADGSKTNITSVQVPTNWISDVEYDGTDWVILNRADILNNIYLAKPTLTDSGGNIQIGSNLASYGAFNYTITQNINLPFPSYVPAAGTFYIDVTMDNTGGWLLSFDGSYYLVPNASVWQTSRNCINRVWLVVRTPSVIDVYIENIKY